MILEFVELIRSNRTIWDLARADYIAEVAGTPGFLIRYYVLLAGGFFVLEV